MKNELCLVVCAYNEEERLPELVESLRSQKNKDFRVLFVNNASTDLTEKLISELKEVKKGKWLMINEAKKGLIFAKKAGVAYVKDVMKTKYVGFLDADSYPEDAYWSTSIASAMKSCSGCEIGYIYGPLAYYFDFPDDASDMSNFISAVNSYEQVLFREIMQDVGWMLMGPHAIISTELIASVLSVELKDSQDNVFGIPEQDLRMSMDILSRGYEILYHPKGVKFDGRRVVASQDRILNWGNNYLAFRYGNKRNLTGKTYEEDNKLRDLTYGEAQYIVRGRARKVVTRNLVPIIAADKLGSVKERAKAKFGIDFSDFVIDTSKIWDIDGLNSMIESFEKTEECQELIDIVTDKMLEELDFQISKNRNKLFLRDKPSSFIKFTQKYI